MKLSDDEIFLIKNYRKLDDRGKSTVLSMTVGILSDIEEERKKREEGNLHEKILSYKSIL